MRTQLLTFICLLAVTPTTACGGGGDGAMDAGDDGGPDSGTADTGTPDSGMADSGSDSGGTGGLPSCDEPTLLTSSDINGGVTLEKDCYLAESDLELTDGVLTIEPGVIIQFVENAGFAITDGGRLDAEGTSELPITLTGVEEVRGFWAGLYFEETSSASNVLDYVIVEYAGGDQWTGGISTAGVFVREADVQLAISNSTFRENDETAILAANGGADLTVESSTFENNALPLWIAANLVGDIAADNSFSGNDNSYLLIGVDRDADNVSDDQTWNAFSIPYRMHRDVGVPADLTIAPGTTLTFEQNRGLRVTGGSLAADASGGDKIRFIAADGETIQGYWSGIGFSASLTSDNIISNAEILYGGNDEWIAGENIGPANLALEGNGAFDSGRESQVALQDVLLEGSGSVGLRVGADSTVSPCSITLRDNATAGIAGEGDYTACE